VHSSKYKVIFAGALSALAFAPFNLVIILPVCFCILITILNRCTSKKAAFMAGWWFGFAQNIAGLYWVAISLTVDIAKFGWLIPLAVSLIPAAIAIFTGITTMLSWVMFQRKPLLMITAFASLWTLTEYVRTYYPLPFPWNYMGYVFASDLLLPVMQSVKHISIYGLSFVTMFFSCVPALYCIRKLHPAPAFSGRGCAKTHFAIPLIAFALFYLTGYIEMRNNKATSVLDSISITLVQPNIPQNLKWDPALNKKHLQTLIDLSNSSHVDADSKTKILIWPESSLFDLIGSNRDIPHELEPLFKKYQYIIAGGIRVVDEENNHYNFWNSVFVISMNNGQMEINNHYDKHMLVPFGEYIPLRSIFGGIIQKITPGAQDFMSGDGTKTISIDNSPSFSPLICYEAIFPNASTDNSGKAKWILNITNDGWFGNSTGPHQHLAMARTRAIEEGIPIARVANSGISAIIDPYGRITQKIPLNNQGIVTNR